nr:AMP-activated protein kinase beta 2 [Cryptomonas paramecium]
MSQNTSFSHKLFKYKSLDFSTKIKDISNSMKPSRIRFSSNKHVLAIEEDILIPMIFIWTLKAKKVDIIGSWDNWHTKIPLVCSKNQFITIIPLFASTFEYKFLVDQKITYSNGHRLKKNISQKFINVVDIRRFHQVINLKNSFSSYKNIVIPVIKNRYKITKLYTKKFYITVPLYLVNLFEIQTYETVNVIDREFSDFVIRIHVFLNHLFFFSSKKIGLNVKEKLSGLQMRIDKIKLIILFLPQYKKYFFLNKHPIKKIYNL